MSVQLSPHSIGQSTPRFRQAVDLLSLNRMQLGNAFEQSNLVSHDLKVGNRPLPCSRHVSVSVQGLAGEDDALIGFGRGHS